MAELSEHERTVFLAKVAERAERYDEMMEFMTERAEGGGQFSTEERDLFSAAFKNALGGRRQAVRVASAVKQQEEAENRPLTANLAAGYRSKVEAELASVCEKCLTLLKEKLIDAADPGEPKIFFLKMQGDYHRYTAEFAMGEMRQKAADDASVAYATATAQASDQLPTTHPVRLGLALNFSVFQHEVLRDTPAAFKTASDAREAAAKDLSPDDGDAVLTMQLLMENLSLWESQ